MTLPSSYCDFTISLAQNPQIIEVLYLATKYGFISGMLGEKLSSMQMATILASYNGGIDVFLRADTTRMLLDLGFQNLLGRNFVADMTHFFYVQSHTVFISRDINQNSIAEGAGLKVASFQSLLPDQ